MSMTSTSSKSKAYPHGRNLSLTSACLPVTSNYRSNVAGSTSLASPSNNPISAFPSTSNGAAGNEEFVAFAPVSPRLGTTTSERRKSWRPFGWGDGAEGGPNVVTSNDDSSDDDLNRKASPLSSVSVSPNPMSPSPPILANMDGIERKRRRKTEGMSISNLLPYLISIIFPSYASKHPNRYSSLSKSSRTVNSPRPLYIRIVILTYVLFSLIHFTSSLFETDSWARSALNKDNLESIRNFSIEKIRRPSQNAEPDMDNSFGSISGGFYGDDTLEEGKAIGREQVAPQAQDQIDFAAVDKMDVVRQFQEGQNPLVHPLNTFSQPIGQDFSFAKLFGKVLGTSRHPSIYSFERELEEFQTVQGERVLPFMQIAAYTTPDSNARPTIVTAGDVTALLYLTPNSLPYLTLFVSRWDGPVSLIFECANMDDDITKEIKRLRREAADGRVKKWVDWHVIVNPKFDPNLNKKAKNWHVNLARFFARTDMIWVVSTEDNVVPAGERGYLKKRLNDEMTRKAVLGRGDMVVVPRFALTEWKTMPSISDLDTLPLRKANLVDVIKRGNASMALWDQGWNLNEGPSNWQLWRKSGSDRGLLEEPAKGGGKGLGLPDDLVVFGSPNMNASEPSNIVRPIGGGKNLYLAHQYDFRFAPSILMSKEGHPWCTERFEHKWEACVYQNYLGGAEVWVLPDAWSWSWNVPVNPSKAVPSVDEAEAIKEVISEKLYTKYRQEACMHYGREILLMDLWDHERARHLRAFCARVFSSWGVGLVSHIDS